MQRQVLRRVSWSDFDRRLAAKGESSVPRVTYLDGVLELMTPSRNHEKHTSWLRALLGEWAVARGVELSSFGHWTLRDKLKRAGAEPDDCYILGADPDEKLTRPHFVIEVEWSRRGINKLEVYKRLGVHEVWFWDGRTPSVYVLRRGTWQRWKRSACLPSLDLEHMLSFLERRTMTDAMREYRAALLAT